MFLVPSFFTQPESLLPQICSIVNHVSFETVLTTYENICDKITVSTSAFSYFNPSRNYAKRTFQGSVIINDFTQSTDNEFNGKLRWASLTIKFLAKCRVANLVILKIGKVQ